jgi:hypothetical protein
MAAEIMASFLEMGAGGAESSEGVADFGVSLRGGSGCRDGGGGGIGRRKQGRGRNEYKSEGKNREAEYGCGEKLSHREFSLAGSDRREVAQAENRSSENQTQERGAKLRRALCRTPLSSISSFRVDARS